MGAKGVDNVVGIAIRLQAGCCLDYHQRQDSFLHKVQTSPRANQLAIQWTTLTFSLGMRWPDRKALTSI